VTLYAARKGAYVVGGATALSVIGGQIGKVLGVNNKSQTDTTQANIDQQERSTAELLASGQIDPKTLIASATGKQLNLNEQNVPALMAKYGFDEKVSGLGGTGVFTGKTISTGNYSGSLYVSNEKPEIVGLGTWKKMFPSTFEGQQKIKKQFEDAGITFTGDTINVSKQLRDAWDYYGEQSNEYSRAGTKLSPWDLLKMQKGLSAGGGSQTTTTIDTSPMAETDIKLTAKRQLSQSLGLANIDDKMYKDILAIVRKNEAKRPTKTIRTTSGNTTKVNTTQGYGQSDVLADVEEYAKQDPRYKDFQSSSVFGQGMIQALGLKA
jgi:hypothetical protein